MNVSKLTVGLVLAAFAVFGAAEPVSADEQLKLKRSFGARGTGESHVQMRSILAPVRRSAKSKQTSSISVTAILTITEKSKVGFVCKHGPRINDALLTAWYEQPMTLDYLFDPEKNDQNVFRTSRTAEQKARDARLIGIVNGVVAGDFVSEIMVLRGTRKMGGGAVAKLPFASVLGCAELDSSEKKDEEKKKSH
ncbi:MAG: hypothetical protein O2944_11170 [Proteobacteria bacterium]|nr:hypothetical protein [Pseudomonadota bacterium]